MNLVIVESPAKAKTIEKYLGRDYKVMASFGHVRDLPAKSLGIDVEKNYKPEYSILPKAKKNITSLKDLANKSDQIYLATDLDREGEAISWHLCEALKLKGNVKRIVFSEITKAAITHAVSNPRELNINLVNSQQARRVLDRLVGYKLSPLLWKKVKAGLSAGRVQSVAVRLIVEREREITSFVKEEFWVLGVMLSQNDKKIIFPALLTKIDDKELKKFDIKNAEEAENILVGLANAEYRVSNLEQKDSVRKTPSPFTTSSLQMEAARKLGFSPKQTMMLAQMLYEAGHITYMRTDSTNLSVDAVNSIRSLIENKYGKNYLPSSAKLYKTKSKNAQEAHEAIRPTNFTNSSVTEDKRAQRLYELIWKRTIASQMNDAIFNVIKATITAQTNKLYQFEASGESIKFDGYLKVYIEGKDEQEEESVKLPKLVVGETLNFIEYIKQQKFTEPPKRYSEAMLVKKLESLGIGRPSTYAPTLETIQNRGYVALEEKRFAPTEIAFIVNDLLVKHFTNIVDYKFTAKMEDQLDDVANGDIEWTKVIDDFYKPFSQNLEQKTKELAKEDIIKPEIIEEKCPKCGNNLMIRLGRFGKFISCSTYPECKYTRPLDVKAEEEVSDQKCEKCGGKMVVKEGRFGKFLACENYPKCKNTVALSGKTGVKCPKCEQGELVEKKTKRRKSFWGCSRYPECDYATWDNPTPKQNTE